MNPRGMTLIELAVVIAIVGILVIVTGFQFIGWQARYKVESQIKEMYADLMEARQRAMQRNRTYFVHLDSATPYEYATSEDNGDNIPNAGDTKIDELSKQGLQYRIRSNFAGDPVDISMNRRGLTSPLGSIWLLDPDGNPYSPNDVDYDCIVISRTRINMGKYDGTQVPPCVSK